LNVRATQPFKAKRKIRSCNQKNNFVKVRRTFAPVNL
jgi:hypothetical protein